MSRKNAHRLKKVFIRDTKTPHFSRREGLFFLLDYVYTYTYVRIDNYNIHITLPRDINARKVQAMSVKDAVVQRFEQICKERNIKINELATRAGVTPSTAYSMMKPSYRHISIVTIKKLCDGLDMTLGEFFSTPAFDTLEQEIY